MGAVVGIVIGGIVLGAAAAYVAGGAIWGFDTMFNGVLTPIMNFLGFHDEDIQDTDVYAAKIFDKNLLENQRMEQHIQFVTKRQTITRYAMNYAGVGAKQFDLFYLRGKDYYTDYLPEGRVASNTINPSYVRDMIQRSLMVSGRVQIMDVMTTVPHSEDWCKYNLQINPDYRYNVSNDLCFIAGGEAFFYVDEVYDTNNNNYVVTLDSYGNLWRDTIRRRRAIENQPTYVLYQISEAYRYTVENSPRVLYTTDWMPAGTQRVEKEPGIIYQELEEWVESRFLMEYPGNAIRVVVPPMNGEMYWFARYRLDDNPHVSYLWIQPVEKYLQAPGMDKPNEAFDDIDYYPVICVRKDHRDILGGPDEEREKKTRDILGQVGIDLEKLTDGYRQNGDISSIQSAFVHLGIQPHNGHWAVSAALYHSFDYVYDLLPVTHTSDDLGQFSAYSAAVKEFPFSCTVFWRPRRDKVHDGRYVNDNNNDRKLMIGEYAHNLSEVGITITRYALVDGYKRENFDNEGALVNFTICILNVEYRVRYVYDDIPEEVFDFHHSFEDMAGGCYENRSYYDSSPCLFAGPWQGPFGAYDPCEKFGPFLPRGNGASEATTVMAIFEVARETTDLLQVVKQISRTRYRMIEVIDLSEVHVIKGDLQVDGVKIRANNDKFIFPLAVKVVDRLTLMEKTALLGESAHLVFYAAQYTHLKWYETAAFASFLNILMFAFKLAIMVFAVVTTPFTGGISAALATKLTIGLGTMAALFAIDKFVQDPALKFVLSAVASVAGMVAGGMVGESGGLSFSNIDFGLKEGFHLADIGSDTTMKFMGNAQSQDFMALQSDIESFTASTTAMLDELSARTEELSTGLDTRYLAELAYGSADSTFQTALSEVESLTPLPELFKLEARMPEIWLIQATGVYPLSSIGLKKAGE